MDGSFQDGLQESNSLSNRLRLWDSLPPEAVIEHLKSEFCTSMECRQEQIFQCLS